MDADAGRTAARVLRAAELPSAALPALLRRFGLRLVPVADGSAIPGTYWGEPEAGIVAHAVYARGDTPVHSVLHETCHTICMTPARRACLNCDAGGDALEEEAVCYLQIVLGGRLDDVGQARLMRDMDAWGYSFRLGSSRRWFTDDAADARDWLIARRLLSATGEPTFRLRQS